MWVSALPEVRRKGRKKIIIDSIKEYLNKDENNFENLVEFVDKYNKRWLRKKSNQEILKAIKNVLFNNGIPFEFNVYRKKHIMEC